MIKMMGDESRKLVKGVVTDVYFMRGAIQYDQMLTLPIPERLVLQEFLEERFDVEKDRPATQIY